MNMVILGFSTVITISSAPEYESDSFYLMEYNNIIHCILNGWNWCYWY